MSFSQPQLFRMFSSLKDSLDLCWSPTNLNAIFSNLLQLLTSSTHLHSISTLLLKGQKDLIRDGDKDYLTTLVILLQEAKPDPAL